VETPKEPRRTQAEIKSIGGAQKGISKNANSIVSQEAKLNTSHSKQVFYNDSTNFDGSSRNTGVPRLDFFMAEAG
jgi:hypothetical protein